MDIKLINGWKGWWSHWSTWLITTSISLLSFTPEILEAITYAWAYIPVDIRTSFTEEQVRWTGLIIGFLAIPAKYIKQRGGNLEERDVE